MSTDTGKQAIFPTLTLKGLVAFPEMVLTFDVSKKKSAKALNAALETNQLIYLITQRTPIEDPEEKDLYKIGCVATVRQVLKLPDGGLKVQIKGLYRAKHTSFSDQGSYMVCSVEKCEDLPIKNRQVYVETLIRRIRSQFERYVLESSNIAQDIILMVAGTDNLGFLVDYITFHIPAPFDDKQYILEQLSPVTRAKILLELLEKEREIIAINNKISEKTRVAIDENQREYYLREQIKAISSELYGDDVDETEEYFEKIDAMPADEKVKIKLRTEVQKLLKMPQGSHEGTVVRGYLDTCLELPWDSYDKVNVDVAKSAKILDRDFYGMKKIKERILEMLSVYALAPEITGQIICLIGPPGVGKTSIGKTIAECMGRKFARVSLGGVRDEAEIRGHRRTYIGAMPGRIIAAIKQAGSSNPLILLDEIDKLGSDYKGDPASALLEALDPEQNHNFVDHFIDMPYDLSKVVFITTANTADSIPAPLYDRMEVIELSGYTREEKYNIAKKHLISKELSRHGLSGRLCRFTDEAIYCIIDYYTREAGVRRLQREIAALCRKSAKMIAENNLQRVTIREADVVSMLGKKRYRPEMILEHDCVGIINGLAWTAVGGEIMQLEVSAMQGNGKVELTGSLGDVMKESAKAAISYVRANAARYGIDSEFYKNLDIHIHATEAAIPKDGPSAGVTIATGIVSALTGRAVRRDIAMTGEVTIRGRVLAIGGLKEKAMAAHRGGIRTVFIPKDNIADIDEIDQTVREAIQFIPVSEVDEIISAALVGIDEHEIPVYCDKFITPVIEERIVQ